MAVRMVLAVVAGGLLLASTSTAQTLTPATPPQPRAVVVLDSAGTMLNPLETFKKYYLVRKTLKDGLVSPPIGVDVGLITYGNRSRTACDDIQVLRAIEPFDATRFVGAVFSVRPRGQALVSEALKAAAAQLGPGGGKVLLIAGGADSCKQDACATAKSLAEAEPGLAIDVLAMGASEADAEQLRCIAGAGHGRIFAATSMADTPNAFDDAFAALAAPPAIAAPSPVAAAKPAIPGRAGLSLSALLVAGGPDYGQPLNWTVRKTDNGKPGEVAFRAVGPTAGSPLPPGSYDVEAAAGAIDVHQNASVTAGTATDLAVNLNAGSLRLHASGAKPEAPADDISYTIYRTASTPSDETPDSTVAMLRGAVVSPFLLPAGNYRIIASRGGMRLEHALDLTAGEEKTADFALATGSLQIAADAASDANATAPVYFVSEDDPDQPLGRRDVAQSAMANPSFELPPGLYHVSTRKGAGKVRLDAVVKASEVTTLAVPPSTGRLRLETQGLPGGATLPEDLISYTVERLDETGKPAAVAARSSSSVAAIDLEAGHYRVTGRVGLANIAASAEVAIKAGAETRTVLRQDVGLIDLAYGDVPAAAVDVLWEIRGADGKVVWSTTAAEPLVPLLPGSYTVHALRPGKEQSVAVTLAAGERKAVAIKPE